MSKINIDIAPEEFDRILIALNWYVLDREKCAEAEEWGVFDAGPDECRDATKDASNVLERLRRELKRLAEGGIA